MFRRLLLTALLIGCLPSWASAQEGGCNASFTDSLVAGLIASSYVSSVTTAPSVALQTSPAGFSFRPVCLSSSGVRNRYRFVSLVAYYSLNGSSLQYGQFEFECVNSAWSATSPILRTALSGRVILAPDSPALNATVRTDCSLCLNLNYASYYMKDPVNHCYGECIAYTIVNKYMPLCAYKHHSFTTNSMHGMFATSLLRVEGSKPIDRCDCLLQCVLAKWNLC